MLLEAVNIAELRDMLRPHMQRPSWPGLDEDAARQRARRYARRYGLWKALWAMLERDKTIPVLRRSVYRCYLRHGVREPEQEAFSARMRRTDAARAAVWLKHPAGDIDHLQDLLWAWCDEWKWTMAAHEESQTLDLRATAMAVMLAETIGTLRDVLEAEVVERVEQHLWQRILLPAADPREPKWWATCRHNWNHVCNANLIGTALNVIHDHRMLADYIHPLILRMDYALEGFAADGGCLEGPTYWNFGFGHYLDAAVMLHHRTGGRVNLMADERAQRIARYPLAAYLGEGHCATFGDAHDRPFTAENVLKVNYLLDLPRLYGCVPAHDDGTLKIEGAGGWHGSAWRGLTLVRGQKRPRGFRLDGALLPDLGQVTLRTAGRGVTTVLSAIAGHNGVNHNHNDVGSFVLLRCARKGGARLPLTDPGAPAYSSRTFSPRRYEILFCRSRGHSVPEINGREQSAGDEYRGTLSVEGLGGDGAKGARIDMTAAYDEPTLRSLVRLLELDAGGRLTIHDDFRFTRKPRRIEEAFVTYESARVERGGRRVRIGTGRGAATLEAMQPGRFKVQRLVKESKADGYGKVVTRITFEPRTLERRMTLAFAI